jgi:hypothetical protein
MMMILLVMAGLRLHCIVLQQLINVFVYYYYPGFRKRGKYKQKKKNQAANQVS